MTKRYKSAHASNTRRLKSPLRDLTPAGWSGCSEADFCSVLLSLTDPGGAFGKRERMKAGAAHRRIRKFREENIHQRMHRLQRLDIGLSAYQHHGTCFDLDQPEGCDCRRRLRI